MHWHPFEEGRSLGTFGSEGGCIVRDEEHVDGARMTLEQGGTAPFNITCGIYGWMVHTRFFAEEGVAQSEFTKMQQGLQDILNVIPPASSEGVERNMVKVEEAITAFVERFPL